MKIGRLHSKALERNGEVGIYEYDVEVDPIQLDKSGDRRGFVLSTIRTALVEQIFLTGVPAEFWLFTFEDSISQAMGFSTPTLRFDGSHL